MTYAGAAQVTIYILIEENKDDNNMHVTCSYT